MSTVAIIQARLGSVRLPNKVLLEINGEKIIDVVNSYAYGRALTLDTIRRPMGLEKVVLRPRCSRPR